MFFVIDGIDASGKTTQVELLSVRLREMGKTVKVIDFPRYTQESSYFVRQYLSGKYGDFVDAKKSSLFFALDRFQASFELREDLKKYDYIIANRYVSSSMIHHACKIENEKERQAFIAWLEELEYEICAIPRPDKIFFLSLSFENNIKLLTQRNLEKEIVKFDLHESDKEHLQKAWNMAHQIAHEKTWETILCEEDGIILSKEEISKKILKKLLP